MPKTKEEKPQLSKKEQLRKERKERMGIPYRCGGSFIRGKACGECVRCQERGYTKKEKQQAAKVERERTKHFPADRVKTRDSKVVVNVVVPEAVEKPVEPVTPVEPTPKPKKDV